MDSRGSTTIPLLPAVSFDEATAFWQALGFELVLRQKAPNSYAVVRYEDFELHLFGLPRLRPEDNFTTCLVVVTEVELLHALYLARLQDHLGRSAYRGLPRLSRMRPGQTRFTVTDVSGNSVIFVLRGDQDSEVAERYQRADLTPLQRALALAERERDFRTDDAAAGRVLDRVIERHVGDPSPDYRRAVEARLELAVLYEEHGRIEELRRLLDRD